MEPDLFEAVVFFALLSVGIFCCLLMAISGFRWALEEWQLSGPRAVQKMTRRVARERERELYKRELREVREESRLASYGSKLVKGISDQFFDKATAVFGELRAVRTGLSNYAGVCHRTLEYLAGACDGLTTSPYELADLAPERKQAQLQVVAIAASGLQILKETRNTMLFDSSLVVWKLNLQKIRYQICANCPVVQRPEEFRDGCPVMRMTREVDHDGKKEQR